MPGNLSIVFAGTPEFAAVSLRGLHAAGYPIIAVYTQPDRPAGRGRKPRPSAVKMLAIELGLPVHQPRTLRDPRQLSTLAALEPALMVVAAYGLILPPAVLEIPRLGCINVHASLLPRWRGAAPIQRAILAGDTRTGVSIMRMEEGLDTGPVLASRSCEILGSDTAATLHDRLAALGRDALIDVVARLVPGPVAATAQDDALATYAPRIDKSEAHLDWDADAAELARRVRAFNPAPGAWALIPGAGGASATRLKVLDARAEAAPGRTAPGEVLEAHGDRLTIACARGALRLLVVQPEGRRPVTATEFLNARGLVPGVRLK